MNLNPVGDRVIVKADEAESITSYGIIIPDTAQDAPQRGTVIAVGKGGRLESGKRLAPTLIEGDQVLYSKYGGVEIEYEGEDYLVLHEQDVIARIVG